MILADDLAYCLIALRQRQKLVQLAGQLRACEQKYYWSAKPFRSVVSSRHETNLALQAPLKKSHSPAPTFLSTTFSARSCTAFANVS